MIRLLVVDDSPLMRRLIGRIFEAEADFVVERARNGVEALEMLHSFAPDVVTLDINMPEMDGLTCLDRIMVEKPCRVVMLSASTEDGATAALDALELGAVDFVIKPEGAITLELDSFAPHLIATVRGAAGARFRRSLRLREQVKLRLGAAASASTAPRPRRAAKGRPLADRSAIEVGPVDHIVIVGTSTGGPPALDALLEPLPADFPWPIVIAQHMPASFTGALARRLDRLCDLTVGEVSAPTILCPGHVYIGRGDADIIIGMRGGKPIAMAAPSDPDHIWHPSVDRLVRSAMDHFVAADITGVLMTGMGSDGAEAMTSLHAAGGVTIAESEETAVVWGMPGALVKAGGAGTVLPLNAIARALLKHARL